MSEKVEMHPRMLEFLVRAISAKSAALVAGERAGKFDCPKCGEKAKFVLVGARNHIHAACPTKDCLRLIE